MPALSIAGSSSPLAVIDDWSNRSGSPRTCPNSCAIVAAVIVKVCPRWVVPPAPECRLRMRMTPPPAAASSVGKSLSNPREPNPVAELTKKLRGTVSRLMKTTSTYPSSSPEFGTPSGPSLSNWLMSTSTSACSRISRLKTAKSPSTPP